MANDTGALDQLITSTLQTFEDSGIVQDTIFGADPLLALLTSKGKKSVKGGREIVVNLRYGKNANVGSYAGMDPITKTEIDTLAHATFQWKQESGAFVVPEIDLIKNQGSTEQIVDLWKEKIEVTTLSLQDEMVSQIYADGTGNTGKDILGLKAILSDTGILGGIDRASSPWWRAQITTYAAAADKAPSIARIKSKIRTLRGPGGRPEKSGKVDMALCNQAMYDYIESLIDLKAVQQSLGGPVADLGFDVIKVAGCEITWSENVPDGEIWYLSTAYLGIRVLPGRDFAFTDAIKDIVNGVDSRSSYCLWAGNLIVSNCRYLGRDTGYVLP